MKAHATDIVFGIDPKPSNIRSLRPETRQCHNCGEMGHLRSHCPEPLSPRNVKETFSTSVSPQTSLRQRRQTQQWWLSSERQCHNSHGFGHLQHQCPTLLSPSWLKRNVNVATPQQPRLPRQTQQRGTGLRCYTCGKARHITKNCFAKPNPAAAMLLEKAEKFKDLQEEINEICARCYKPEYETNEPLEAEETEVKAAACQPDGK